MARIAGARAVAPGCPKQSPILSEGRLPDSAGGLSS